MAVTFGPLCYKDSTRAQWDEGLRTVDLATLGVDADWQDVAHCLGDRLSRSLSP